MANNRSFFDLYAQRFARAALAIPRVSLGDPASNSARIGGLFAQACDYGAALTVFPELSVSGYALDDLHQQDAMLDAVLEALSALREETRTRPGLLLAGAPLRLEGRLFNCAVAMSGGKLIAIVPKSYVPNYREFYEKRQFAGARDAQESSARLLGENVPFGADLLLRCADLDDLVVHVEVCEDVWAPIPPSTYAALRGATVLANLSASNITIGKASYRQELAAGQSAKTLSAYLYTAAGQGESTTDLAWDGHAFAYENGELLAESRRFSDVDQIVYADIDLDRLVQERARLTSFVDCASDHRDKTTSLRTVSFGFKQARAVVPLERRIPRLPFVPSSAALRDERCFEAYSIQVSGLTQRLRATGIQRAVIGVSGGLDSTHALLVVAQAMDRLKLPRENVLAYSMPGYATSEVTRKNALRLMQSLGVTAREIDIRPSCEQMFKDISHPFAKGEKRYDVTFENVQAGERTSHLFRLANLHNGLVVGTGDLSELALGWCTYGVGDQMAHYNVNASVPKTLIRYLIQWVADSKRFGSDASEVLLSILATEISPELVPGDNGDSGPSQSTEKAIGPYELHDFTLYYLTRRGYAPAKLAFLAAHAWANDLPGKHNESPYALEEILRWQRVFYERFFATSQFKRTSMPNGPKVGSGGSLSPRGDWRAPSDSSAKVWLEALDAARQWIQRSR